jgi:hypothetical protein
MFQPTLPVHPAELMHASEFERQAVPRVGDADAGQTRLVGLSPTLLQDLQRYDPSIDAGPDLLQVLAAALRHDRALQLYLELDYRIVPLSVWPRERAVRGPLTMQQLLLLRMPDLRVLQVEPLPEDAAADAGQALAGEPLNLLLWELALRGPRKTLLPEIAGPAAYRVSPATDLSVLQLEGSLAGAVSRLRLQVTPLREIAKWPGFDRDRAQRLLNGLYLQAALMISRTHPSAAS